MTQPQERRLWQPIAFTDVWRNCDTTVLDGVTDAWYARREELQQNSQAFNDFMAELKREHAIETGVIERLYDLDRGVTETMIRKGFIDVQVAHRETNIPVSKLYSHLTDHMEAVDFVFDMVKENRALTIGFIHELHALVTRNQATTEARDQFGNRQEVELLRGAFKEAENNPVRPDGSKVLYCPPVQVQPEMEKLVEIYNQAVSDDEHPVITAAWVHHAFTTIHPYQDGNGRVARLVAGLILIKNGLFPFTVRREEAKEKYLIALEKADDGDPQPLVSYFCETQREHIEKALNLRDEAKTTSLDEVARLFTGKLEEWQSLKRKQHDEAVAKTREQVFSICLEEVHAAIDRLQATLPKSVEFEVKACSPSTGDNQHWYVGQVIKYAKKHNYYFNRHMAKGWVAVVVSLNHEKWYRLGYTVHHQGPDDRTLVIGAFLNDTTNKQEPSEQVEATLPLEIRPVLISSLGDAGPKTQLISKFVQHALTVALGHIASEL